MLLGTLTRRPPRRPTHIFQISRCSSPRCRRWEKHLHEANTVSRRRSPSQQKGPTRLKRQQYLTRTLELTPTDNNLANQEGQKSRNSTEGWSSLLIARHKGLRSNTQARSFLEANRERSPRALRVLRRWGTDSDKSSSWLKRKSRPQNNETESTMRVRK